MATDERQAAASRISDLITLLKAQPAAGSKIVEECEALARAVSAFHMEGIRFRIFNVDRLLAKQGSSLPPEAAAILEEVRHHLEAAGFHTRSHQAPG
ncbi:MAG: hypothetical protein ACRD1U_03570 [Vicinamibacterales bacterium]